MLRTILTMSFGIKFEILFELVSALGCELQSGIVFEVEVEIGFVPEIGFEI